MNLIPYFAHPVFPTKLCIGFLVVFCLQGCSPFSTVVRHDPRVDFSSYRTFSWISKNLQITDVDNKGAKLSSVNLARIKTAIDKNLKSRGYTHVELHEKADFIIKFAIDSRERVAIETYPTTCWTGDCWPTVTDPDELVYIFTEGQLSIEALDSSTMQQVWNSIVTKRITDEDRQNVAEQIKLAVDSAMRDFPVRP